MRHIGFRTLYAGRTETAMIVKQHAHCQICDEQVDVMVDGRAAARRPLKCLRADRCARTEACRFVNPLTVRVPLSWEASPVPARAS